MILNDGREGGRGKRGNVGGGTEGGVGRGKWLEGRKEGYPGSDKRGKFLKKL